MRAALYTRVSTRDKGQDTANQLDQLRDLCRARSWEIVAEYEDHDTGSKPDRTHFQALMRDAARGKFDVVLFWALDRFTREGALETLQYLNALSSYGVGFLSFTEPYLDSCGIFKDAVIAILGTIAKQERLRIQERVRAGLNRAKAQGTKSGKPIGRPRVVFRVTSWPSCARKAIPGARLHAGRARASGLCDERRPMLLCPAKTPWSRSYERRRQQSTSTTRRWTATNTWFWQGPPPEGAYRGRRPSLYYSTRCIIMHRDEYCQQALNRG